MDKYEQISVVGEGSYGLVMKCRHKETDQLVAIKKFLETEDDATIRKVALREIRMLKKLRHDNLIAMIEVFRHRKRFYLVFEYVEGTVLDELEKVSGGLGDDRSRERIFQVIRAVNYCHSNHIIHRDVKPENVLVSASGVVKLCDFGFARLINISGGEPYTEYVATRWYRAPELLVGEVNYGPPVDVWAIGCLFSEMMTGDPLFPGESDIDQLYLIVKMLGKPCGRHQHLMARNSQLRTIIKSASTDPGQLYKHFPDWSLYALDFLAGCMRMDPQGRLAADDLLKAGFFVHDRFPQRFLPALRDKVAHEYANNPLLRKFKTELLMSADKRNEMKAPLPRKPPQIEQTKWKLNMENINRKKYNNNNTNTNTTCDMITTNTENDRNLISLAKTSQRLSVVQKTIKPKPVKPNPEPMMMMMMMTTTTTTTTVEKGIADLNTTRPNSDEEQQQQCPEKEDVPLSPLNFQSLQQHYGFADYTNKLSSNILHPSINNISFHKDLPKKSPSLVRNNNNNNNNNPVPFLGNTRTNFLKKLERSNVVVDNVCSGSNVEIGAGAITWLNGFASNMHRKKDFKERKNDDFTLPTLPGATTSPNKNKKKNVPELDLPATTVTPRIQSSTSQNLSASSRNLTSFPLM